MLMEMFILETGKKIRRMVTVFTNIQMVLNTKAIGNKTSSTATASSNGLMAPNTKALIKTV